MADTEDPNAPIDYPFGDVRTDEQKREAKAFSARCGHIKRRLNQDERLEGPLLELALDLAGEDNGKDLNIAKKLKAGEKLSEYEYHVFVEVILLHARLSA